jgi:hypothetical protein
VGEEPLAEVTYYCTDCKWVGGSTYLHSCASPRRQDGTVSSVKKGTVAMIISRSSPRMLCTTLHDPKQSHRTYPIELPSRLPRPNIHMHGKNEIGLDGPWIVKHLLRALAQR